MVNVKVEVEGAVEVSADLTQLGKDFQDIPMEEISKMYADVASSLAPKDTGALSRSIRPSNDKNKAGAIATQPYAMYVNYGTKRMKPTYFMNRADQILSSKVLDSIESSVDELIKDRSLDA